MTINPAFGIPLTEGTQKYPAIQATDYKPKMGDDVGLCLSENSVGVLAPEWKDYFAQFPQEIYYDTDKETVYLFPDSTKFIFLGIPRMFAMRKKDKQILPLQRGIPLKELGAVTATRCLVLAQIDGSIVNDADGCYQFFTLKLTSTKTQLLSAYNDAEYRSLSKLNQVLIEKYKLPKQSWTHLVTIGLKANPHVFSQKETNEKSIGVLFEFDGKPEPLSNELQQVINLIAISDDVRNFLKDPFGLSAKNQDEEVESFASFDETGF